MRQEKGLPADTIATAAERVGIPASTAGGIDEAIAAVARLDLEASPRILVTGSLYLAGEVLAANGTEPV